MGCCQCCARHTVRDRDAYGVWHKSGRFELYEGPAVFHTSCYDECERLSKFIADEKHYLHVTFLDGHTEHIPGPCFRFRNPTQHSSIVVREAINVNDGEVIVVMKKAGVKDDQITRNIIRGPRLHIPEAEEWMFEFSWHGSDRSNPEKKVPGALKFTHLRVVPDQMYITIPQVRTCDDALMEVGLMIFWEIKDVEVLLSRSHDPIADMMNAATADVIAHVAGLTYEQFLAKTDMLNTSETYAQLLQRSASIGLQIGKVVFRGFHAGSRLQGMHDDSIAARTQLRLEAETEEQAQRLADLKQMREAERQKKKQEMERATTEHNNMISRLAHMEKMAQEEKLHQAELATKQQTDQQQVTYLIKLKEIGVDLNSYLTAQYPKPSELIQISPDLMGTNLHVHANSKKNN